VSDGDGGIASVIQSLLLPVTNNAGADSAEAVAQATTFITMLLSDQHLAHPAGIPRASYCWTSDVMIMMGIA